MGSAVTTANERTRIKSVVKWLIPSSEWARAKFSNDICYIEYLQFYFTLYKDICYVVKIIAQSQKDFTSIFNYIITH